MLITSDLQRIEDLPKTQWFPGITIVSHTPTEPPSPRAAPPRWRAAGGALGPRPAPPDPLVDRPVLLAGGPLRVEATPSNVPPPPTPRSPATTPRRALSGVSTPAR